MAVVQLNPTPPPGNPSFLYSQHRRNLEESRRNFLSHTSVVTLTVSNADLAGNNNSKRVVASKKISFKVKKTASIYRRGGKMGVSSNVSQLASKFNQMNKGGGEENNGKVATLVRRTNSQNIARKPSVKTKPERKPKLSTGSFKDCSDSVRAKMCNVETNSAKNSTIEKPLIGNVKATIEIFERRTSTAQTKPKVPEKNFTLVAQQVKLKNSDIKVTVFKKEQEPQPRKSDSIYETLKPPQPLPKVRSEEAITSNLVIQPNSSFLWRRTSQEKFTNDGEEDWRSTYDEVKAPEVSTRLPIAKPKMPLPQETEEIYEELQIKTPGGYKETEDGYEYCSKENIYECVPPPLLPRRKAEDTLPPRPRPPSTTTLQDVSNCYESIYSTKTEGAYESIDQIGKALDNWSVGSNRDSLVSSDQQSNSLYGKTWGEELMGGYKAVSLSSSERSDEWIDLSEGEEGAREASQEVVIIREKHKTKKTGWAQKVRRNKTKTHHIETGLDSDSDHHYESITYEESHDDDFDSFESDTESEKSLPKTITLNDSGVDINNTRLPDPPQNQTYVLTRLAATANKHMKRFRSNWSVSKIDFTKSLSRMTKRKSRTDLSDSNLEERRVSSDQQTYQNVEFASEPLLDGNANDKTSKGLNRKSFLQKFRRSMSMSAESASELTQSLGGKPKSMFYLTESIDVDAVDVSNDSGLPASPVQRSSGAGGGNNRVVRPSSPPPPVPLQNVELRKNTTKEKRSTSWYTECGLFKNQEKRPNTFWYAEVGLYHPKSSSTPSTSSAENSGTNTTNLIIQNENITENTDDINEEEFYNLKNESENDYYNQSIKSCSSGETKMDRSFSAADIQLRLQDEPLYQFYNAAVVDSACDDSSSEFDYEEVGERGCSDATTRPSAMELVAPVRNSIAVNRTLWCEVPEVISSSVLSTLSPLQMKLQEAKFEMVTSEASYLNSLSVLVEHFIASLDSSELLTSEEKELLFGKIAPVKECSEKLLYDLELCWQDNILLNGICDIVQKHAEENFSVYVTYCENQILLDSTLKKLKERISFAELLRQLENSSTCQSLTLYSFLMLPMQKITRWPLLIDAVLKRLSPQDNEYVSCQYALATMNKIVSQCNEAARNMERKTEMRKLASQLEFAKNVAALEIVNSDRWLVRSGLLTHMTLRTDETILTTFGKRFNKTSLHMFLFNDLLVVAKPKSDDSFCVIHYCMRNMVDITNTDSLASLPFKDSQGKNLLFLTILENQDGKTVEFLFACSSESDKERWIEALTPRKSEDPDETLYECWDYPQVSAVHDYVANQPDELTLNKGDVINVTRKMADGWYHGERIRDMEVGWFPANYTREIANPHVRARNLKQRYRLLAFSENYLKSK